MSGAAAKDKTFIERLLDGVEAVGNKVPHPVMIFVILIGIVIVLSQILAIAGATVSYEVINPVTHKAEPMTTSVRGLLTVDGLRFMFTRVVPNLMGFNAIGIIIVAMVGVGVAEASGLVNALIRKLVVVAPPRALTYILVFVGIVSSIAADAGYLVLIPLAGTAYLSIGRHPMAGLALGFSSVAAAFLVNVLITPTDGILTEITNDAIHLVNPGVSIDLTANVWFSIGSVALLVAVIGLVNERIVEPRLGPDRAEPGEQVAQEGGAPTAAESRGLRYALWGMLGGLAFVLLLLVPPGAPLRDPDTGAMLGNSPFMGSLIVTISLLFGASGIAYGMGAGTMRGANEVLGAMTKAIASLGGLILLLLVIAQFLAIFSYTNMAIVAAVTLGDALEHANLGSLALLVGFILVNFLVDFILTGAVAAWAIMAPIFVPLLMHLNVPPDAVLAAYRVGDSPINAITPLNAYFALIVTFAQKYQKDAGVGTVIALMLPHVAALCVIWTLFFVVWYLLGLPWGL
jgi:aminobenzoyl-glutamate transport protein